VQIFTGSAVSELVMEVANERVLMVWWRCRWTCRQTPARVSVLTAAWRTELHACLKLHVVVCQRQSRLLIGWSWVSSACHDGYWTHSCTSCTMTPPRQTLSTDIHRTQWTQVPLNSLSLSHRSQSEIDWTNQSWMHS